MASTAIGIVLGGVSANAFSQVTAAIGFAISHVALLVLSLINMRYAVVENAGNYAHLNEMFRKDRGGVCIATWVRSVTVCFGG